MNNTTTIYGGGASLLLALLAWMAPFPINLILISILTVLSIAAFFTLDMLLPNRLRSQYRLHEVVPAMMLDIGVLAFLVTYLDTVSVAIIWFGVLLVTTGYILRARQPISTIRQTWGRTHYIIGGSFIVFGILWSVSWGILGYINQDDDVIRWSENIASQVTQEEDWYLVLTDNESVRYLASVDYLTHNKMEFSAVWIDSDEYGETIGSLEQSGYKNRYSRYSGEVTIRPAGNIPLQHGTAQLEEVGEECFTGNMEFPGIKYEAKLHKKGVRCG